MKKIFIFTVLIAISLFHLSSFKVYAGGEIESLSTPLSVTSTNSVEISLSTNRLDFIGANGTRDIEQTLNLTIKSSLIYDLTALLKKDILNSETNNSMDYSNLMIKEINYKNSDYSPFISINTPVLISENNTVGENIHSLNLKLLGDGSAEEGIYRTSIGFNVIQK